MSYHRPRTLLGLYTVCRTDGDDDGEIRKPEITPARETGLVIEGITE